VGTRKTSVLRLYPGVLLQSAFGDFLRNRLDEKASLWGAIEMAFEQYRDKILTNQSSLTPLIVFVYPRNSLYSFI